MSEHTKVCDLIFSKVAEISEHAFIIPGDDPNIHVAVDKYFVPVIMRDERAAAFAAQIYSRIKGFGVCVTSHGPGMSNLTTGLAAAFLEQDKVLAISSQLSSLLRKNFNHAYVSEDILRPITKDVKLIGNEISSLSTLNELLKISYLKPQGPVALILPQDISDKYVDIIKDDEILDIDHIVPDNTFPNTEIALNIIENSENIIAIIGSGPIRENAIIELKEFLDKTAALPFTTLQAKGTIGHNKEITISRHNLNQISKEIEYDLCIMIGVDKAESIDPPKNCKNIISIGDNDSVVQIGLVLSDDMIKVLRHLNTCSQKEKWVELQELVRSPSHIVEIIAQKSSEFSGIICVDTGLYKHAWASFCQANSPLEVIFTNGLSSIGWSISAAIGAHYATGRPTLAIIGDGGFSMSTSELFPIMQYNLPISILIINDNSFGMIKRLEEERLGKQSSIVNIQSCKIEILSDSFGFQYSEIKADNISDLFAESSTRKIFELKVCYDDYNFSHH